LLTKGNSRDGKGRNGAEKGEKEGESEGEVDFHHLTHECIAETAGRGPPIG